jgi:3-isopropylmalate/(R)-2-methylmalate dehydratase small subunit
MEKNLSGKAFVFGPNIDTDQIYPGRYLALTDPHFIGQHAMEGADPEFKSKVQPGDIIVAETIFGCGSSREQAVITLKSAGIGAVLAESFGRIFYRNGINLGLPLIVVPGITAHAKTGDLLSIQIDTGWVLNLTCGEKIRGEQMSEYMFNILESGGIKNLIRQQYSK